MTMSSGKPTIEIREVEGAGFSLIRINGCEIVGTFDWSPDRSYGLASGRMVKSGEYYAAYVKAGEIIWESNILQPFDVIFCLPNIVAFTHANNLLVTDETGLLFETAALGERKFKSFARKGDAFIFSGLWIDYEFDHNGHLTETKHYDKLLTLDKPYWLRWDKLKHAQELHQKAERGDCAAGELAETFYLSAIPLFDDSPTHQAKCYRYLGELSLLSEQTDKAIEYWKKALDIDSAVGVKIKLKELMQEK